MSKFNFSEAYRFIPVIFLIGIGIGTANFLTYGALNWIQYVIQSVSTSFCVGYTLVILGLNHEVLQKKLGTSFKTYTTVVIILILTGFFATELEHFIRALIFKSQAFQPFSSGNVYLVNAIIAIVLGLSFFYNQRSNAQSKKNTEFGIPEKNAKGIQQIPVKKGPNVQFIMIERIVFLEAFDNYAFVFVDSGEKQLCDYSLLFLEQRLPNSFLRVHRKYIVNTSYIKQVRPHMNGRYVIDFLPGKVESITSSKSYTKAIKSIIKLI